jgi:hypothetical protein
MNRLYRSPLQTSGGFFSLSALRVGLPSVAAAAKGGEQWGEISRNQISRIVPMNRLYRSPLQTSGGFFSLSALRVGEQWGEGRGEVPAIFE